MVRKFQDGKRQMKFCPLCLDKLKMAVDTSLKKTFMAIAFVALSSFLMSQIERRKLL